VGGTPEVLLCDTRYLGIVERSIRRPDRALNWPETVVERLSSATLAISVITVAETRAGFRKAGFGSRTIEDAERLMLAYVWIPLDMTIVDEWAELDAECKKRGGPHVDDNDKWIAATAIARDLVLVTCDKNQADLPGLRSPVYLAQAGDVT
jgi:predicted nucleic acid-binding protein